MTELTNQKMQLDFKNTASLLLGNGKNDIFITACHQDTYTPVELGVMKSHGQKCDFST